jgi:hypothetical protein
MELHGAAFLPTADTRVSGSIDIDWIQGGAAVAMRQGDSEHPPAAVWIIGRDDTEDEYVALYSDDRGVSRVYRMSIDAGQWKIWRDTPEFSQRFRAELEPDGLGVRGRWEKSTDRGANWQHDFNIDYIRDEASGSAP